MKIYGRSLPGEFRKGLMSHFQNVIILLQYNCAKLACNTFFKARNTVIPQTSASELWP